MWDAFISYASEDKDTLVKPLANVLRDFGVDVWHDEHDEFELKLGDSLSKSIDKGLNNSRYGIVMLRPSFFKKDRMDYEYRSLAGKEVGREKCILPVWHDIPRDDKLAVS